VKKEKGQSLIEAMIWMNFIVLLFICTLKIQFSWERSILKKQQQEIKGRALE